MKPMIWSLLPRSKKNGHIGITQSQEDKPTRRMFYYESLDSMRNQKPVKVSSDTKEPLTI